MPESNHSIHNLLAEALRESTDLARKEFALFKTEMSENVRALFMGLAMMVLAAVFAIAALMLFTQALVDWLATVVDSDALAAVIVGGAMTLIAVGLGLYGRSAFSSTNLAPQRTLRSVQRDTEVLSERVTG